MTQGKVTRLIFLVSSIVALLSSSYLFFHFRGRFFVPWKDYQLLDPEWLKILSVSTLSCLHSQPPLLNLFAFGSLRSALGLNQTWDLIYLIWGFLGLAAGALVVRRFGYSFAAGLGLIVFFLLSPEFRWFSQKGSYAFPVFSLLLVFGFCLFHWVHRKKLLWLVACGFLLLLLSLLRSLYTPTFCIALLIVLSLLPKGPSVRKKVVVVSFFSLLLSAWPMKNYLFYGFFGSSSWSGYSISRMAAPKEESSLSRFFEGQPLSRRDQASLENAPPVCQTPSFQTEFRKSNGATNWHHISFVSSLSKLTKAGIHWRKDNLSGWARLSTRNFIAAFRASHLHPYEQVPLGITNTTLERIDEWYRNVLYHDLRPNIESVLGEEIFSFLMVRDRELPLPLFLFVWIFVISGSVFLGARMLWSRSDDIFFLGPLLILCVWNVFVPALTDGIESNRMRFETFGLFVVLTLYLISKMVVSPQDKR